MSQTLVSHPICTPNFNPTVHLDLLLETSQKSLPLMGLKVDVVWSIVGIISGLVHSGTLVPNFLGR